MMRLLTLLTATTLLLATAACGQNPAPAPAAAPASPSVGSYGIGINIGRNLRSDGVALDVESLIQGLRDGIQGAKPRYSEEQLRTALDTLQRDMQTRSQQRAQAVGEKNQREGEAFLAENKKRPNVVTLPSGLQYEVLKAGNGPSPKATDKVTVNYEGKLLDGTVFDSSIQRGQPATFPVNGVIPGWTEALQRMKVGDKWRLFVPPALAYGARGAGDVIGPNAVLTFDVELLAIEPAAR